MFIDPSTLRTLKLRQERDVDILVQDLKAHKIVPVFRS
jgi:hypothetical protein